MVARGKIRNVHSLGCVQRVWTSRMGDGDGRHTGHRVREDRKSLHSQAERRTRLGEAGQAGRDEVHGDDHEASRRFLPLRYEDYELLRPQTGPGLDLVKEYVEAARAEGLRVGFYYSLMDWHHPDGARSSENEAARRRFVDYIHTHIRELMTNYGKIDILW